MKRLLFKQDFILKFCKDKNVIHVGATDAPYHLKKFRNGKHLHKQLMKVSNNLIGLDYDKEAIRELENEGVNSICYGDIVKGKYSKELLDFKADVIVLGDVIEHLPNPQKGLSNLKKLMGENTKILITTPNVFSYYQIMNILVNKKEVVHPDHCFWPSKTTLSLLIEKSGFCIDTFNYGLYGAKHEIKSVVGNIFYNTILKRWPKLGLCLIYVIKNY